MGDVTTTLCVVLVVLSGVVFYLSQSIVRRLEDLEERIQFLEDGVHVEITEHLNRVEQLPQPVREEQKSYRGPTKATSKRTMWDPPFDETSHPTNGEAN